MMETNQTKTYPDKTDEDRREAPGIETNDTKASYIEANYIKTLLSQIREKRARERVRREVESHLEDQKACYLSDGMTQEEASRKAVADMGSPEEAGAALDRIHRPKPAWGMLAIIAALCAAGVLLQYTILKSSSLLQEGDYFFKNQLQYAVLGFAVLCIIYLLDYTVIAAYCRQLCTGILLFLFLILLQKQMGRSGMYWLNIVRIGGFDFSISVLFYLYVPLYGALLHSYRSCRKQDLWKILLYTVLPVFFSLQSSVPLCLNITLILCIILAAAILKGWLGLPVRKTALAVLAVPAALAVLFVMNLKSYQLARLASWLNPSADAGGAGYVPALIRSIINSSQLVGPSTGPQAAGFLPDCTSDYLLAYTIGQLGILTAAALVMLVLLFGARLLHISLHQKNQLGMIMGLGCSLVFGLQSAEFILVNLTILPPAGVYFPLISFGGSGMIHTCILLGLLLSIYRYENVVSEPEYKKLSTYYIVKKM